MQETVQESFDFIFGSSVVSPTVGVIFSSFFVCVDFDLRLYGVFWNKMKASF